jgi:ATP-binding cassette subfamily F protein 3
MAYILEARNLKKYYGSKLIFSNLDIALESGEKAGLIGANGIGKTTLMHCLMDREIFDEGTVQLSRQTSIGYLEQIPLFQEDTTLLSLVLEVFADVFEQRNQLSVMEASMSQAQDADLERILRQYGTLRESYERSGGMDCESLTRKVLYGLGFEDADFQRTFASFSGGEKTRISLARLLVREYDILFLDEPTNHLDLEAIEWLENYLKAYRGALLIISHDRYFLDQVIGTTFNMEAQALKRYKGNYSNFLKLKAAETEAQLNAYEKQQREVEKTQDYILRNKAGIKSKQARGRETRLTKMVMIDKPQTTQRFNMGKAEINTRTGEKVLYLEKIAFSFGNRQLFSDLEEEIQYQDRVALLGPNGMGKTTLLKIILGQLNPQKGKVRYGSRVKIAYFDQEHSHLNPNHTVLSEIIQNYDVTIEEAKSLLARFMFHEEDWEKKILQLSGGEKGRISLLKLTLDKGNFLILDEPTNHLDVYSRETMERYLQEYPGTILMVSHDRYFVDAVADRIFELNEGQLTSYMGNYSDYKQTKQVLQQREQVKQNNQKKLANEQATIKSTAEVGGNSKNKASERARKAKLRENQQVLEQEIEMLETRINEITEWLADPETYQNSTGDLLQSLTMELQTTQQRLPLAYAEWEEVAEQLEEVFN